MQDGRRSGVVAIAASLFCGFCAGAFTVAQTQTRAIAALEVNVSNLHAKTAAIENRVEKLVEQISKVVEQNSDLIRYLKDRESPRIKNQ